MEISNNLLIKDSRPYVLWRRVSTVHQGESGLGLEAQTTIAEMFTRKKPDVIFTDIYSGTKLKECENLWKAIDYCKEHDCLLVIAKTDRFRNVREALEVLENVGEGNLSFCDMPQVNRFILTIMFAVWESQAMMGRVNTKLALDERRKQLKENGGWVSRTGKWRTHFGSEKGCDTTLATQASIKSRMKKEVDWEEGTVGFQWVKRQLIKGVPRKDIIAEFNENFKMGIDGFCSRDGKQMTAAILSKWVKKMGLR